MEGFPHIKFDPKTTIKVEEALANSYGLDLSNPDMIKLVTGKLEFSLVGGIDWKQYDRMYVTLKVRVNTPVETYQAYRSNLDLIVNTQVNNYCKAASIELERPEKEIKAAIAELIHKVEKYKTEKSGGNNSAPVERRLTGKEKKEALNILESDNLTECIEGLLIESGVVGDTTNALRLFYMLQTRHFNFPVHALLTGDSMLSRNLIDKLAVTLPDHQKESASSISEQAFYYGQHEETWKGKVIHLNYLDREFKALKSLGDFMESQHLRKIVTVKDPISGRMANQNKIVKGPIMILGFTQDDKLYKRFNDHCFFMNCGDAKSRDAYLKYQNKEAAGLIDEANEQSAIRLLQAIQAMIEPIKVINPYQRELELPKNVLQPLRTNRQLIVFIQAVTLLHQHQVERKVNEQGVEYIETTPEHIEIAIELLKDVMIRKSDTLTHDNRLIFEMIKGYVVKQNSKGFKDATFKAQPLLKVLGVSKSAVHRRLQVLENLGFIEKVSRSRKNGDQFQILDWEEYEEIQSGLDPLELRIKEIKCPTK
ncbi:MAG: hypothetical protein HRT71_04120 [Flavobacteriales bacterium]|nr:hypothetical protein [Flavobacteriales bacterium]